MCVLDILTKFGKFKIILKFLPCQNFFNDEATNLERTKGDNDIAVADGVTQNLGFVAGVVNRDRVIGFERMLWRVSRGNVYLRQADIEIPFKDPKTVGKVAEI